MTLESDLSTRFRRLMPDPYDHRPGFLGHIVVELMLDAYLAETDDSLLNNYYAVLDNVAEVVIQNAVNQMATRFLLARSSTS